MSSPFVWFHHNGKKPNETKAFLESLLSVQSSEGPGGLTMLATSAGPFAALGSKADRYGDREEWIPFVAPERGLARLPAVLRAIHLLFNEGYWSGEGEAPIRADLCRLALGLARSVVETYPREAEACGLLALLLLHEARRDARLDDRGKPVPLPEQDRTRWDHASIAEATALLDRALTARTPGPFQTEAAIAAVHCRARSAAATEWSEIASLYALLEGFRPTPAVRVNRAFAVGKAQGPTAGLALLDGADIDAAAYPYVHLVRGALLAEGGLPEAAVRSLREAARAARNEDEKAQIEARIARLLG